MGIWALVNSVRVKAIITKTPIDKIMDVAEELNPRHMKPIIRIKSRKRIHKYNANSYQQKNIK